MNNPWAHIGCSLLLAMVCYRGQAQVSLMVPQDPLLAGDYGYSSSKNLTDLDLELHLEAFDVGHSITFRLKGVDIRKGIHRIETEGWFDTVWTVRSADTFTQHLIRSMGLVDSVYRAEVVLRSDSNVIYADSLVYRPAPLLTVDQGRIADSTVCLFDPRVKSIHGMWMEVFADDSIGRIDPLGEFAVISSDYDSLRLVYKGKPLSVLGSPERVKPQIALPIKVPDPPFTRHSPGGGVTNRLFAITALSTEIRYTWSDTNLPLTGINTPYYTTFSSADFRLAGVPLHMEAYGLNEAQRPMAELWTNSNAYFNLAFDPEAFRQGMKIDPNSPAFQKALQRRQGEFAQENMLVSAELDSLKAGFVPPDSLALDTGKQSWLRQLPRKDRRRYKALSKRKRELSGKLHELDAFEKGLGNMKANGELNHHMDSYDVPESLQSDFWKQAGARKELHNLQSAQIGHVYPTRFSSGGGGGGDGGGGLGMRPAFVELFGASAEVKVGKTASVYGLAAQNRLSPFMPMAPFYVLELGARASGKRVTGGIIGSMESSGGSDNRGLFRQPPVPISGFGGEGAETPLVDSVSVIQNRNLIGNLEYQITKRLTAGIDMVIPTSNTTNLREGFDPLNQRTRISGQWRSRPVGVGLFTERHPGTVYSAMDMSALQNTWRYGGSTTVRWLKGRLTTTVGYEVLDQVDSTENSTRQTGATYSVSAAFAGWPQVTVSYVPFSSASFQRNYQTGQSLLLSNQSAQWTGTAMYQRVVGNQMIGAMAMYAHMTNTTVFQQGGIATLNNTVAAKGEVQTITLQAYLRGRIHSVVLEGNRQFLPNRTQQQAVGTYEAKVGKRWKLGVRTSYGTFNLTSDTTMAVTPIYSGGGGGIAEFTWWQLRFRLESGLYATTTSPNRTSNPYATITLGYRYNGS